MARYFVMFVLFSLLSCWVTVHAQFWGECKGHELETNFYDCLCGYKETGKDMMLQCVDTGYTDASIISKIPFEGFVDELTNVTFTGNNFEELPVNLFGDCSHEGGHTMGHSYLGLDYLDLSNNNIGLIHGKTFHCIQNLRYLMLNDNNLDHPGNSPRMFSDLEALEVLHLKNAFNFDKQGNPEDYMVSLAAIFEASDLSLLRELNLASNYIGTFSVRLFEKLPNLEVLDLSDNYLTNPVISSKCTGSIFGVCALKELHLNSNSISQLSEEFMENMDQMRKLEALDVSDNPFWCDCSFKESYNWLKLHKKVLSNSFRLTCIGPPRVAGKSVLSLNDSDLEECLSKEDFSAAAKSGNGYSSGHIILIILLVTVSCVLLGVLVVKRDTVKEKAKSQLNFYFPRLYSRSSGGYDSVAKSAATV